MKSTVSTLESNKVKLSVEVDEREIDAAIDEAFKKIAKEVRLPGFRPGKAPRKVLEARLGRDYARSEAIRESLPEYYRKAVIEHDVDVIASPEIDITGGADDGPVAFEAIVEVRPVINVAGYQSLRVEVPSPIAADDEIATQIDSLRSQFAERVEVDRPAAEHDYVTMDITGSQDGEPVEGLTAEDYTYEIGSGFVVDGIDDALIGAGVGDERTFEGDHPSPDEEGILTFSLTVKRIEERVLPELDDAFVAEATEFATVAELEADTRSRIETMRRSQLGGLVARKTSTALAELVDVEIPESLVQDSMQGQLQDMAMRLASQGMQLQQFLEATGQPVEALMENLREPAEEAAKVDLALRAIVAAESLDVSDDDLEAELAESAAAMGRDISELRQMFVENGQLSSLRADLAKRRAMDWLIERVEIVDEDGNPVDRALLDDPDEPADGNTTDDEPVVETTDTDADTPGEAGSDGNEGDEQ